MNFCPNCGNKVNITDKFCSNCGYKLQTKKGSVNSEDVSSPDDTFVINENNGDLKTTNTTVIQNKKDEVDETFYNPLKKNFNEVVQNLYKEICSLFGIKFNKSMGYMEDFVKVVDSLKGRMKDEDITKIKGYIKISREENHLITLNEIESVELLTKYIEKQYRKKGEEIFINKKLNRQLRTQLTVLSNVLISIFDLPANNDSLSDKYEMIISKLNGKIRESELNDLEDKIIPLCINNHSATVFEIEMIKKMVNQFDKSYNKNHTERKQASSQLKEKLNYLSGQSSSAIADAENLSKLQEYMHVERGTLESDLLAVLKSFDNIHGKLVFLVGNVGDGKSYSIGYLKKEYPNLFEKNNVHIYYDATESFDPHKTAMETLLEELNRFSDNNLEKNTENWIIAINMGVLMNFVRRAKEVGKFNKIINYLDETGIVRKTSNISNINSPYFSLISFRNYPLFDVDETGISSPFYDELFDRVVKKTDSNPFYKAYLKDKSSNLLELAHHNYELFSNKNVRDTLKYLLIKIQLESKVIISTRALLELIHDILVPNEIKGEKISFRQSLPYLLFGGSNDSVIIKKISAFDPANIQNALIEDLKSTVYNSRKNPQELAEIFLGVEDANKFEWLWRYIDQESLSFEEKVTLLVRIKFLVDRDNDLFRDTHYYNYLKILHSLEIEDNNSVEIRSLYKKIQNLIYLWCGSPREGYVFTFINDEKEFGVAIPFYLKFDSVIEKNFNVIFKLENLDREKKFELAIDYDLFILIDKVNNGYLLKNSDKHQFVNVATFVENIIKSNKSGKETLIGNIKTNKFYRLTNDGMGINLRELD